MRKIATGLIAAAGIVAASTTANAQLLCGERENVVEKLSRGYQEKPVAMGLTSSGAVVEILSSGENGQTWTMIATRPDGVSCVMATGESWQPVESELAMNEESL
ncbi:hypothetical protein [Minwuia thermotolerans]|uniref:Uncharacterized protein n=1 Tax=Minwuia thermotolerans TaxID=2056226 RepID=A0A2M9FXY9_9PROT|nr:hypothetical protein [Minwuia thermotolerans]PJK28328.1 hypothetical protein CVT23_18340 [Minwuia thermotolerans]